MGRHTGGSIRRPDAGVREEGRALQENPAGIHTLGEQRAFTIAPCQRRESPYSVSLEFEYLEVGIGRVPHIGALRHVRAQASWVTPRLLPVFGTQSVCVAVWTAVFGGLDPQFSAAWSTLAKYTSGRVAVPLGVHCTRTVQREACPSHRTARLSAKRRSQKPGSRSGGVPHAGRAEWEGYLSQTCRCIGLRPPRSVSELVALASFETLVFVV